MVFSVIKVARSIFVPQTKLIVANLIIISALCTTSQTYGQNNVFSAQIITGVNFSQIRGDQLAGYHRVGLGAGVGVSYRIAPRWSGHIQLMYRNAGSRNSPFSAIKRSINIHMAQIPVYASYLTWWDNGLSRIHFDIGMIYGRIIKSRINFPQYENNLALIKDHDLSIMAGMGFWFNHHHGINVRYIRSLSILMENPIEDITWQLYYISLQYQYRF